MSARAHGAATFLAFVLGGIVPLVPYVIMAIDGIRVSFACALAALFVVVRPDRRDAIVGAALRSTARDCKEC